MNKSYTIKTNLNDLNDKHIKIKLENEVSEFNILSLNINQKDFYPFFNCDHGVLVGRVLGNERVGIPNAKVSIFIPISDEDLAREDIVAIYPYLKPRDINSDGKRYNLLPRVATSRPDGTVKPLQPFGSFPSKEEFVTNETFLEVYKKYYKYSTVTNEAGDYMLYGVPTGQQTVHMSVDITDIGKFSMKPPTMVTNLGYSPFLFKNNNTRIKENSDLLVLPNIETQEISVDIIPFCGDENFYDIGITRQDFRVRAQLTGTFTLFGSAFTDGFDHTWGSDDDDGNNPRPKNREFYTSRRRNGNGHTMYINTKRIGNVIEKIFTLDNNITDNLAGDGNVGNGTFNSSDYRLLDKSEYSRYTREGDYVYIVPCNRRKIITNEQGEEIVVPDDFVGGVFTEFKGFLTLELSDEELPMDFSENIGDSGNNEFRIRPIRLRFKFPQNAKLRKNSGNKIVGDTFDESDEENTEIWRKQHFTFRNSKFYSLAKFHPIVFNDSNASFKEGDFMGGDVLNNADGSFGGNNIRVVRNSGVIVTDQFTNENADDDQTNPDFQFPHNATDSNNDKFFGGNWMNLSIYFPQFSTKFGTNNVINIGYQRHSSNFTKNITGQFYTRDNTQEIAGGVFNTKLFARSDLHHTDIIEVPIEDINNMVELPLKGFKDNDVYGIDTSYYKKGQDYVDYYSNTPVQLVSGKKDGGGRSNLTPTSGADPRTYFYKGLGSANCIDYLFELGIL